MKNRELKECPRSSATTDTNYIYYRSLKSLSGVRVDTDSHSGGDMKVHTVNNMDHILQYHMI